MILKNSLLILVIVMFSLIGCNSSTDTAAHKMCEKARLISRHNPIKSIQIYRDMWRNLPMAGTSTSKKCSRDVALKIGSYRVIARQDKNGSIEAVNGCIYTLTAIEAFGGPGSLAPFKMYRAISLVKKCKNIVGRAWTRHPEDPFYDNLNKRMDKLLDKWDQIK
ncbi:MAG: hypothetical protein JXR91_10365 [Deltaproteobacteria bacterium]|nr:hypothetical protein [Deltaproteobacteria bacterium]